MSKFQSKKKLVIFKSEPQLERLALYQENVGDGVLKKYNLLRKKPLFSLHYIPLDPDSEYGSTDPNESRSEQIQIHITDINN